MARTTEHPSAGASSSELASNFPGLLAGETMLRIRRGRRHSGRLIRLDQFYRKLHGLRARTTPYRTNAPAFAHAYDHALERVVYTQVFSVVATGTSPCIRLVTDSHSAAVLPLDTRVLLDTGRFVPAQCLRPGSVLSVRGSMLPQGNANRGGRKERVTVEALKYYASGWMKYVADPALGVPYEYKRQNRAVLVVEAAMNDLSYEQYLYLLKNDPAARRLNVLPPGQIVHHRDANPMNDQLSNLEVMDKEQHDRMHADVRSFNVEYTSLARVLRLDPVGERPVFRVCMLEPHNVAIDEGLFVMAPIHWRSRRNIVVVAR